MGFLFVEKTPGVTAFSLRMIDEVKPLYHTIPNSLSSGLFHDELRTFMRRLASVYRFYRPKNISYSVGHASIISTKSRTVQNVIATLAATAGVHLTAILDFTKLLPRPENSVKAVATAL